MAGGNGYRDQHAAQLDDHILAMESDGGVFAPRGFGFSGSEEAFEIISPPHGTDGRGVGGD